MTKTEAERYQPGAAVTGQPTQFVYTTVQYDLIIKSDTTATVNKISPPTVKRPK